MWISDVDLKSKTQNLLGEQYMFSNGFQISCWLQASNMWISDVNLKYNTQNCLGEKYMFSKLFQISWWLQGSKMWISDVDLTLKNSNYGSWNVYVFKRVSDFLLIIGPENVNFRRGPKLKTQNLLCEKHMFSWWLQASIMWISDVDLK